MTRGCKQARGDGDGDGDGYGRWWELYTWFTILSYFLRHSYCLVSFNLSSSHNFSCFSIPLFSLSFSKLVETLWFVCVYMYVCTVMVVWWAACVTSFAASLNFYLKACIYWLHLQVTAAPPTSSQSWSAAVRYFMTRPMQSLPSFIYRVW